MSQATTGQRRRLSHPFLGAAAVALVMCFALPFPAAKASETAEGKKAEPPPVSKPHEKLPCEDCHKSHGVIPPEKTGRPCLKCHEDQAGDNSHPVDIPYKGEVPPEKLPLSVDGKITCNTCHILHEPESSVPALLRKKFNDLCMTCHYPDKKPSADAPAPG